VGKRKGSLVFNGDGNRCIMREDQANGHVCGAECSDGKDISIQRGFKRRGKHPGFLSPTQLLDES